MSEQKTSRKERFMELYEKYSDDMYRYAFSILRNETDAQDAVQNALIRLYEHLNTVTKVSEEDDKEEAYVMTITRHAAYDLYAKNKSNIALYNNMIEDKEFLRNTLGGGSARSASEKERETIIQECLRNISDDYCNIIALYYYQGYSLKEISELYEISERTATVRLHRARKAVEREMKKLGYYEKLHKERRESNE